MGRTIDRLTAGRWAINVTSGWHEQEFPMFGAELLPHDERYARSREFIEIMRRAWSGEELDFAGRFYQIRGLKLEPTPIAPRLEVWQGGQSDAAIDMAANYSDWMFLNGGLSAKIAGIIAKVRERAAASGRNIRFGLYAIPICRESDAAAEREIAAMIAGIDREAIALRKARIGARGMWSSFDDPLTLLDSNEGLASRLIGNPETIMARMREFHEIGVDCFHLTLQDGLFNRAVLPRLNSLDRDR